MRYSPPGARRAGRGGQDRPAPYRPRRRPELIGAGLRGIRGHFPSFLPQNVAE